MKLSFNDVAVFILGTTTVFHGQSSFISRAIPIKSTWGQYFNYLYFVFGNSFADYRYIQSNCHNSPNSNVSLNLNVQIYNNYTESFECKINQINNNLKIIRFLNCSSGYYGDGPTCRCQEAMWYYLSMRTDNRMPVFKWFVFQDDDIYLNPVSFLSFLTHISSDAALSQSNIAIASAKLPRGLFFSSSWDRIANKSCNKHMFPITQPAILNTHTVLALQSLIEANGLMRLRKFWKGTHDHLLGMSLWLYNIPVFSLSKCYYTSEISDVSALRSEVVANTIVYHRMRNWNATSKGKNKRIIMKRVIGQYEIHEHLISTLGTGFSNAISNNLGDMDNLSLPWKQGQACYDKLFRVTATLVSNTSQPHKFQSIRRKFVDFNISDC